MPITNQDTLALAMASSRRIPVYKASQTAEGAGTWHSLWKAAGQPGAGSNPPAYTAGSGYVPTSATAGALPFVNPAAGVLSYLTRAFANSATVGTLILYDRLWACSGLSLNTASTQTVTTPGSLTRPDALGADVEIWGEVYTAGGASAASWTVSYTDQDGNTGQTATYAHPANAESVGQMVPYTLAAGDTGVRAIASVVTSATGTAGDYGITLLRRIAEIPVPIVNIGDAQDALGTGLPRIYDSACLAWMVQCSTTNTGNVYGSVTIGQA